MESQVLSPISPKRWAGFVRSGKTTDFLSRENAVVWADRVLRQEVTFMVRDDEAVGLDGVGVGFDDEALLSVCRAT